MNRVLAASFVGALAFLFGFPSCGSGTVDLVTPPGDCDCDRDGDDCRDCCDEAGDCPDGGSDCPDGGNESPDSDCGDPDPSTGECPPDDADPTDPCAPDEAGDVPPDCGDPDCTIDPATGLCVEEPACGENEPCVPWACYCGTCEDANLFCVPASWAIANPCPLECPIAECPALLTTQCGCDASTGACVKL